MRLVDPDVLEDHLHQLDWDAAEANLPKSEALRRRREARWAAQDPIIIDGYQRGIPTSEIASWLGPDVTKNTVVSRARALGLEWKGSRDRGRPIREYHQKRRLEKCRRVPGSSDSRSR